MRELSGWGEKKLEQLEEQTLDYIIGDDEASTNFLSFIDEYLAHKEPGQVEGRTIMQRMVNAWLETSEGMKWFTEKLEWLIENTPEDDEPRD